MYFSRPTPHACYKSHPRYLRDILSKRRSHYASPFLFDNGLPLAFRRARDDLSTTPGNDKSTCAQRVPATLAEEKRAHSGGSGFRLRAYKVSRRVLVRFTQFNPGMRDARQFDLATILSAIGCIPWKNNQEKCDEKMQKFALGVLVKEKYQSPTILVAINLKFNYNF